MKDLRMAIKGGVRCGVDFVKNNKLATVSWLLAGVSLGAKAYPSAAVFTIIGIANYAMDRVVDKAIEDQVLRTWKMFTPEQRRQLVKMANVDNEYENEEELHAHIEAMLKTVNA